MIFLLLLPLSSLAQATDLAEDHSSEATGVQLLWVDNLRMSLKLADSRHHTILLSPASNLPGEPTPCLFSGALEQDKASVVAVSGCRESIETVVTIASRLVPEGLMDLVVSNGTTHIIGDDNSVTERQMQHGDEDMIIPPANPNPPTHHRAARQAIPSRVVLKTRIRYDNTLLRHFSWSRDLTRQWLSRMVEMAKPRLALSSLNTKIQLQLLGEMEQFHGDIQADQRTLDAIKARNPRTTSVTSYFCSQLGGGTLGIAFRGTACRQDGYAININKLYTRTNSELNTARVWVHELGHNIGMRHDFDAAHGGEGGACNNQGLMSYNNRPDRWTTCSNNDFATWFRREGYTCLASAVSQEPKCDDNNVYCKVWADQGHCTKSPDYMNINCQKACKKCKGDCEDENKSCTIWANKGYCISYGSYMKLRCKSSCKLC